MNTASMIENLRRALSLDRTFYQEMAHNTAIGQEPLVIVLLASLLASIGDFFLALMSGHILGSILALILGFVLAVAAFYLWIYAAQFIAARFFHSDVKVDDLQRVLGYAYAPMALRLLVFIPCAGGLVGAIGGVWSLVAGFFAIREAARTSDGQSVVIDLGGWVAAALITGLVALVVGAIFGLGAVGIATIFSR